MASTITVTLRRSSIGRPQDQRATLKGLGLTKLNKTVTLENTPAVRGMIKKVIHLLEINDEN